MQSQDSVWKARLPVLAQTLATRGWAVGGQLLSLSHTRPCLQGLPPCVAAPWLLISDPPAPLALQTACAAGRPGALSSSAASVVPVPADASRAQSVREPWFALCLEQCWGCWRRCPHMITFIPEPSASRCHLGSSHAARGAGPCRWPVWQSLPGAAQQAFPAAQTPEGPMVSQVHCAGSVLSLEGFVSPVLTPNPKRRQGGVPHWGRGRDRTRRWPVRCFGLRRKGPGCPRPGGTGTAGPRACPRSRAIRAAPSVTSTSGDSEGPAGPPWLRPHRLQLR